MNGNKVLSRLIQVFVVINLIFLGMNITKSVSSYVVSTQKIKAVTAVLEDRGIIISGKIPRIFRPTKSGVIIAKEVTSEWREGIVKKILDTSMEQVTISRETQNSNDHKGSRVYSKGAISLSFVGSELTYSNSEAKAKEGFPTVSSAKRQCERFIKKAGLARIFKDACVEVVENPDALEVTYYADFKGIPVFNSFVRFRVVGGGIEDAFVKVADIGINEETENRRNIYPAHIVLFSLEDLLPGELEEQRPLDIVSITLGYYTSNIEEVSIWEEELVPVYKIIIRGLKDPVFVNAYTNKRIK